MKKILTIIFILCTLLITGCKNNYEEDKSMNDKLKLTINNQILYVTLENNKSSLELVDKIKNKPIAIEMDDYGNFEKVGELGFDITTTDKQIKTDYGDIILYQGNKFVIYYDKNEWNFTKLGHIDNITQEELKNILGTGSVEVKIEVSDE